MSRTPEGISVNSAIKKGNVVRYHSVGHVRQVYGDWFPLSKLLVLNVTCAATITEWSLVLHEIRFDLFSPQALVYPRFWMVNQPSSVS